MRRPYGIVMVDQLPWLQRRCLRHGRIDYRAGRFFITLCTHERRHLFGEITDGAMQPNTIGTIVEECWQEIPAHFRQVQLDVRRLMPDHLHGILCLATESASRVELGTIVGSFKSAVSKRVHLLGDVCQRIWQRGYHDHHIRDESHLPLIREYINQNPNRWQDGHHPP